MATKITDLPLKEQEEIRRQFKAQAEEARLRELYWDELSAIEAKKSLPKPSKALSGDSVTIDEINKEIDENVD